MIEVLPSRERGGLMKAQKVKQMVKLQEWAAQITACKQSGLSIKKWCEIQGICTKTFYYRLNVVREEMLELAETAKTGQESGTIKISDGDVADKQYRNGVPAGKKAIENLGQTVFAALPMPQLKQPSAVTVRVGEYSIDIQRGADEMVVEQVLRLVARL